MVMLLVGAISFSQDARVQVLHNSPDAMTELLDVYINGALAIANVPFRTASPFSDLPAGVPLIVSIALGGSSSVLDAFYNETFNFTSGETYLIIAEGILSGSGYNPAPPFSLETYVMARETSANPTMIDVLVHHGSTDAPTMDIYETEQELGQIVDNISYTDYEGYLEFPAVNYVIELRDETGTQIIEAYVAPLESLGLEGTAVTLIASGFMDPSQNSNGPAFGLYVLLPLGGNLIALPPAPLGIDDFAAPTFSIYPNPMGDILNIGGITLSNYSFQITDMTGRIIAETSAEQSGNTVNVGSLATGVYVFTLVDGNQILNSVKFIKN